MIPTDRMIRSLSTLVLGVGIAACGGDGPTNENGNGTNPLAANSVNVGDNFFNPESVTVSTGTTVTWTWIGVTDSYTGVGPNTHAVTFNDGFGSSDAKSSGTQTRQFNETGTFEYFCSVHSAAAMSGKIIVQ